MTTTNFEKVSLFASSATWIEGEAVCQLEKTASLEGLVRVAGFPDLHPGKGFPVGTAALSEGAFYPLLVGSDIGCGMSLFETEIPIRKAKPGRWFKKLKGLEKPWSGPGSDWLESRGVQHRFESAVGTIGQGNHFAELLRTQEICDDDLFSKMGLLSDSIFLLVHSGSRGLGDTLFRKHIDLHGSGSLKSGTREAEAYLQRHDHAVGWATANRELIAYRLLEQLDSGYRQVISLAHNHLTAMHSDGSVRYLHRKGVAPSDQGPVIIPGSRGTLSYLVMPIGDQGRNLWSMPHGAGRKWKRSECKGRLRARYPANTLLRTQLGSFVICDDSQLLYEEAPQAYKDIDNVIADMVGFGAISVIASLRPVLTYKGRNR